MKLKNWILVIVLSFLSSTFIACGKSSSPALDSEAQALVDEHRNILNDVNVTPLPTANSTDADIKLYERKLNRLETLERELNMKTSSIHAEDYFSKRREYIAALRARKAQNSSTLEVGKKLSKILDNVEKQTVKMRQLADSQLRELVQISQEVIADCDQGLAILSVTTDPRLQSSVERLKRLRFESMALRDQALQKLTQAPKENGKWVAN